jgi:hypothetical protein
MDYMHPTMLEALRGHWPHIAPGTPPAEAQRVAADLDYQQHRESGRAHRALQDQVQHLQSQGVL